MSHHTCSEHSDLKIKAPYQRGICIHILSNIMTLVPISKLHNQFRCPQMEKMTRKTALNTQYSVQRQKKN